MKNKLFIGNLDWHASEDDLREALGQHGNITDLVVIRDRATGRSKGFGFVTFETEEEAQEALAQANGLKVKEREIRLSEAQPMEKRERNDNEY
jgi:RNA recognition motif-containing protein